MQSECIQQLHERYALDGDLDLGDFLRDLDRGLSDEDLAALIEADGRWRLNHGREVSLRRYLDAVPDLRSKPDSLDAAVDVTLRWTGTDRHAVGALMDAHPDLAVFIDEAATLNSEMRSTAGIEARLTPALRRQPLPLPQDFGPPLPPSADVDGTRPRYQLRQFLGEGAYGQVYLAIDRQLSEDDHPAMVAIKILIAPDTDYDRRAILRQHLVEEATKARRVDHPNVVRVLDRGVSAENEDFIVYELVEGGDLYHWLRNYTREPRTAGTIRASGGRSMVRHEGFRSPFAPLAARQAVPMMIKIARGVQAAHAAGLVHCDLTPGNVMLTLDGEPKVADFGIAVRISEHDGGRGGRVGLPTAEQPRGNPIFASPEQYRRKPGAFTVPSDVYALGGILFLLLTGRPPNGCTAEEVAHTHEGEPARRVSPGLRSSSAAGSGIDSDLEAICRRALADEPLQRYSSAGAMADDLEAWMRREPLYWTRPSPLRVMSLWMRRRPGEAIVTALLAVAVISGATLTHVLVSAAARAAAETELVHARAEAEHARAEIADALAEIERVRAEEEAMRTDLVARHIRTLLAAFQERAREGRAVAQILPLMWGIDSLIGPDLLGTDATAIGTSDVRFTAVERLVELAREEGRERHLDSLLWQATLAFWLVGRGDGERAQPLIDEARRHWADVLRPDDRWLGYLDAIAACAVVARHAPSEQSEVNGEQPTTVHSSPYTAELAEAGATLVMQERSLSEHDPGGALHFLVLETLERLLGPQWLDEPEAYAKIAGTLDRFRGGSGPLGGSRPQPPRTSPRQR
jgi:serine/threonine protein kinase